MIRNRLPGLPVGLVFPFLVFFSALYSCLIRLRNFLYDKSFLKIHSLDARVVSVGNITVGGTGKTPIVQVLAEQAIRLGLRPGVIARGYKGQRRNGRIINDEGRMLLEKLPDLALVQDPDRFAAAKDAQIEMGADFLILDDGFQHRRLHRDLDLVVIDATRPFGFGRILPAGLLREPLSSLKRADALVLTRCDQADAGRLEEVEAVIQRSAPGVPVFRTEHAPLFLRTLDGKERLELDAIAGRRVCLFCGIANPAAFERTVRSLGAVVSGRVDFPDHHEYGQGDWEKISRMAEKSKAERVLTTAKDGIKLNPVEEAGAILVLEVGINLLDDEEAFFDLVFRKGKESP